MRRDLPPLNALRAFEAAARYSSYSQAAQELSVVHTSVAHHVRNLEDWFGVKLFARVGRNVQLTDEGLHLYHDIEQIFGQIEDATRALKQKSKTTVKLSIEPILMHQWFAKRVFAPDWSDKMRGFELETQSSFSLSNLAKGEADIAIRHVLEAPVESETAQVVATLTTYPYVAPHLLKPGRYASTNDMLQSEALIYARRSEAWQGWFDVAGLTFAVDVHLKQHKDPRVAILATRAGSGAILMCAELVEDDVAEGALVRASDIGMPFGHFVLLTTEEAAARPAVQKARLFLLELFETFGTPDAPP